MESVDQSVLVNEQMEVLVGFRGFLCRSNRFFIVGLAVTQEKGDTSVWLSPIGLLCAFASPHSSLPFGRDSTRWSPSCCSDPPKLDLIGQSAVEHANQKPRAILNFEKHPACRARPQWSYSLLFFCCDLESIADFVLNGLSEMRAFDISPASSQSCIDHLVFFLTVAGKTRLKGNVVMAI
jgi:hypothetical protein